MNDISKTPEQKLFPFFASCPRGLEEALEEELKSLGADRVKIEKSGVSFFAYNYTGVLIALSTRVASRVFKEIFSFKFNTPNELYEEAKKKWWHQVLNLDQTFKIKTILDREANNHFDNSIFLSQKLKDAVVDQYRDQTEKRPDVSTYYPDLSFLQRIVKNKKTRGFNSTILIDLCKEPLSNRGYRTSGHQAPLRENLAAGLLYISDWNRTTETLIDPMSGTGTIIIEAILIKENILPSYLRIKNFLERNIDLFSFLSHNWFLREDNLESKLLRFLNAANKMHQEKLENLTPGQFFASDIEKSSLKVLKENFKNALIRPGSVEINQQNALEATPLAETPGIVICNPPYGERLGQSTDLKHLYHQFGENLKQNFKGYRAFILTSEPELRKQISLRTSLRSLVYNGNIECRLLGYNLF